MPWKPPTIQAKKEALLGTATRLRSMYKKCFTPMERKFMQLYFKGTSSAFYPEINNCDPSDWLLNHKERCQTFENFCNSLPRVEDICKVNATQPESQATSNSERKTIYILPLGPFPAGSEGKENSDEHTFHGSSYCKKKMSLLWWLKSYCTRFFFDADVILLSAISVEEVACRFRVNEFTGRYQLNAKDILTYLDQRNTATQNCLLAVTMIDLYPRQSWNFVFGLATTPKHCHGGVGVISFCRYDENFYQTWTMQGDRMKTLTDGSLDYSIFSQTPKNVEETLMKPTSMFLLRVCKVMTHEICHMFGLKHCVWMQCLMNGSNHLNESDRRPPTLCPICLRKLQFVLNFKALDRYKALYQWTKPDSWELLPMSSYKKKPKRRKKDLNDRKQPDRITPSLQISQRMCLMDRDLEGPPLDQFRTYSIWLREAIEFITSNGNSMLHHGW